LGLYYWWLGYLGFMPPKETNVQCKRATTKALELDDMLAEAHSLMAMLLAYLLALLGWAYVQAGRIDDAKKILDELHELARRAKTGVESLAIFKVKRKSRIKPKLLEPHFAAALSFSPSRNCRTNITVA
jgi:hypothetical protein